MFDNIRKLLIDTKNNSEIETIKRLEMITLSIEDMERFTEKLINENNISKELHIYLSINLKLIQELILCVYGLPIQPKKKVLSKTQHITEEDLNYLFQNRYFF